jgi:hypothetical protein
MGLRVPSVPQVNVVVGDTITFSVDPDADSVLYFAPETAIILTPSPRAPVSLTQGQELIFTFAVATPGSYGVITEGPEDPPPPNYKFSGPSNPPVLVIQPGQSIGFSGPDNTTQT